MEKIYYDIQIIVEKKHQEVVDRVNYYEIDKLIEALECRRAEIVADWLRGQGFGVHTRIPTETGEIISLLAPLVVDPSSGDGRGRYATVDEMKRLYDTAVNLPLKEAYTRWENKISPSQWSFGNGGNVLHTMGVEISLKSMEKDY